MVKHKVFISFYHHDDDIYKTRLSNLISPYYIDKSVMDGEYSSENSDSYVKRLIREDKVSDSSVVIVLIGPNTKNRMHVDWEIYAGLRQSINGRSGLIGVLLPTFPLYNGRYSTYDIPSRLADNVRTGYAKVYLWDDFLKNFITYINQAFSDRVNKSWLADNSRKQMERNL